MSITYVNNIPEPTPIFMSQCPNSNICFRMWLHSVMIFNSMLIFLTLLIGILLFYFFVFCKLFDGSSWQPVWIFRLIYWFFDIEDVEVDRKGVVFWFICNANNRSKGRQNNMDIIHIAHTTPSSRSYKMSNCTQNDFYEILRAIHLGRYLRNRIKTGQIYFLS